MFPCLDNIFSRSGTFNSGLRDMRHQPATSLLSKVYHKPEEVCLSPQQCAPPCQRNDQHVSRIGICLTPDTGQSVHISPSSARAEINCSVSLKVRASDGSHGILPYPYPTMLVPSATTVNPPMTRGLILS